MAYTLNVEQFENLNLYSNRNMERIISNIVNESSNAAFVNMGDDSVILLDHNEGQFYIADYNFDREKLQLTLENFEEIELVKNDQVFESTVKNFFEEDEPNIHKLAESYRYDHVEKDKFLGELINEAMSKKSFDQDADYDKLASIVESEELSSTTRSFFEEYKNRLETHPLREVKRFDWETPVKVSLVETENKKLLNRKAVEKAHDLWKRQEFKENFAEAAKSFVEDVEEGSEELKSLFENFPQVFFLDSADRRTMLGKAMIGEDELRENMKDILNGIDILFEKYDLAELKEEYLFEAEDDDELEDEDMEGEEEETVGAENTPSEVEGEDMSTLISDLKRIGDKCDDERTAGKIEDLVDRLEKNIEEGTRPDLVKEAVSILSL